jgi:glycine N-methyltransferase
VETRLSNYRDTLLKILKDRGVRTVLDVACGTGIDSVMLLEEGYKVVSTDALDHFLRRARDVRKRRPELMNWQIGLGD